MIQNPNFPNPAQSQGLLMPDEMPPQQLDWQTGMPVPDYDMIQTNYGHAPGSVRHMKPLQTDWETGIISGTANDPTHLTSTWEGVDYSPLGQTDPHVRLYEDMVKYGNMGMGPGEFDIGNDPGLSYSMFATPEEIRTQQVTNMLPTGSSGMPSFDQYATTESGGSRFHGNPDDQYGQFRRKQMNMNVSPGQQRMTMTTDPRSKFDKEGFNSGLQMMNMGLGLLD
ncbi:hypothetical protein [uncultured Mediterranean phage uvMED]|nr:hypothetical protein [uncultured Mediterranean phage uvMED]